MARSRSSARSRRAGSANRSVRGSPSRDVNRSTGCAERLRVVRRGRHRRHEREAVVAVDRDPAHERLVGAERQAEHAVAELLERPGRVPDLEAHRSRAGPDHVHREEVVVDDERPRRRQVVAGPGGERHGLEAADDAALRAEHEHGDQHGRPAGRQLLSEVGEVARQGSLVRGRQHDAPPRGAHRPDEEPGAHRPGAQPDDRGPHRRVIRSITRSVDPPSRWSKWRRANGSTFSCW